MKQNHNKTGINVYNNPNSSVNLNCSTNHQGDGL